MRNAPPVDGGAFQMTAGQVVTESVPDAIHRTVDLPPDTRQWAIERGADSALAEGRVAVVVGIADGYLKVCTAGCCLDEPGAVVLVPDVIAAELVANSGQGFGEPWRLRRADQRECYVYAVPAGGDRRG